VGCEESSYTIHNTGVVGRSRGARRRGVICCRLGYEKKRSRGRSVLIVIRLRSMLDEETHGVPLYYPPVELCTGKSESESGGSGGFGESGECEFGESGVLRTDQLRSDLSEVHLLAHLFQQDDRHAEPIVFYPFFICYLRSHSFSTPRHSPFLFLPNISAPSRTLQKTHCGSHCLVHP
jgi:hypothetical protein